MSKKTAVTLEEFVNKNFPLLKKNFNFNLGRPKGISIALFKSNCSPFEACGLRTNTSTPHEKFCRFETLDDYHTVLRQYMFSQFGMYSITNAFEELVEMVYQNTYLLAQDNINKRKEKLEQLLAFEYAAVKNVDRLEWNTKTHIRLFKSNKSMFGVTWANKKNIVAIYFNDKKDWYSDLLAKKPTINYKNIPLIMKMYEEKFVLNSLQRDAVLSTLLSYCK